MSRKADQQAARERVKAMREEQARKQRRVERMTRLGVAAALVVAIVIIGIVVQATRSQVDPTATRPTGISEAGGGVVIGTASAPVVDVWLDFQCPYCRQFDLSTGPTLDQLAEDGKAKVIYHPLSFLGPESVRAANAYGCSVDAGKPSEYMRVLYENQPPEKSGGYTNEDLIKFAEQAGITGDEFEQCVNDGKYETWVEDVAKQGDKAGVQGTPTVRIDGENVPPEQFTPEGITQAVEAASN